MNIDKVINPGRGDHGHVYCHIEYDGNKGALSITGVEGPKANGDASGSCGQIVDHLQTSVTVYADGWDKGKLEYFAAIWRRWHLNDMHAGCEHQRAMGWDKKPIDPLKPTSTYGKHFEGQQMPSWNMLAWVTQKEHPEGLLARPCPVCGYKYGTSWVFESIPNEVIEYLNSLPESKITPAWI